MAIEVGRAVVLDGQLGRRVRQVDPGKHEGVFIHDPGLRHRSG
jgi:hypothetical protein